MSLVFFFTIFMMFKWFSNCCLLYLRALFKGLHVQYIVFKNWLFLLFRNTKTRVKAGYIDRCVTRSSRTYRAAGLKMTPWLNTYEYCEYFLEDIYIFLSFASLFFAEWSATLFQRWTQVLLHPSDPSGWKRKVFPHLHVHLVGAYWQVTFSGWHLWFDTDVWSVFFFLA